MVPASPSRRLARRRLRAAVAGAALFGALGGALGACDPDHRPPCRAAFAHLQGIAERQSSDPELETRFVSACVEAWDAHLVDCLTKAPTAEDALECKPKKKRPG
ncbi:MAG: hypothetical protein KC635_03490 [Myxococcales bacterium]|nr:hypothetical protein [Myxococcales bacterium]MCB9736215.1 hypothetical protein [Deltaproteobacteria bacterium]